MVRTPISIRHFFGFVLPVAMVWAATASATPGVSAGARIPNGSWIIQSVERPAAPLVATATAGTAPTAAWANVQPGRMRTRASCGPAVGEYVNAMAYADHTEHFHLHRPGLPNNTTGDFLYRFYLSGTMRILATGVPSHAQVVVGGNAQKHGAYGGSLFFDRMGSQGVLYAYTDTLGGDEPNMFAGPRGARKIYGVVNAPVGGYYTINVRIPAQFVFRNFPCNESPLVDDWNNWAYFSLNCSATAGATSDFSSTFEFAAQNPIVPDPDDTDLPPDGWTITTGSGEVTLPSPLGVACATGTGEAFFHAVDGQIANLTALDGSTLPSAGRTGVGFSDGFFSLDLTGLDVGDTTCLTISLPTTQAVGTHWWYPKTGSWLGVDNGDDDGDGVIELTLIDGGIGDTGGADGTIHLVGGLGSEAAATWLSDFTARPRDRGVDLAWHAAQAQPGSFSLTARRGGGAWDVAAVPAGDGAWTARDENVALAGGGRVTYELRHAGDLVGDCTVELAAALERAVLMGAMPNPFNPGTRIAFTVPRAQRVRIGVYDLAGRLVATLADGDYGPGDQAVMWNGCDETGRPMPSGAYAVRMSTGQGLQSRLVSLVR
jgi:hypothetical protein